MYASALIDQHPLLRLGLARILANTPQIAEVRVLNPLTLASEEPFDPALELGILMFGLSQDRHRDRALLDKVVQTLRPLHVLLLSDDCRTSSFAHPVIAGCIDKSASSELVAAAVQLVLAGGTCFPASQVAAPNVEDHASEARATAEIAQVAPGEAFKWPDSLTIAENARKLSITPRQFEILLLRAHGLSPRMVGKTLGISPATVKAHASAMYRRLNVSNSQEAIRQALHRGVDLLFSSVR